MNTGLYATAVTFHMIVAAFWIGGMIFMVLVLMPALQKLEDARLRSQLMRYVGNRFRSFGWVALSLLSVTGYLNLRGRGIGNDILLDGAFWSAGYGRMLAYKLFIFIAILGLSLVHDFRVGPRAGAAIRKAPQSPEAARMRRMASWFGRLNLLLAVLALIVGVLLSRGLTG